ncbi:MAG: N-acetyltransferase family protein, partial [Arenicellales bacterium]|nr:N-acetyltransferase family protein [Arenicellales bacterium]
TVEDSVYVAREKHRQGLGRSLLTELIHRCRDLGKRQMIAIIGDSRHNASIRLHENAGFRHVGTLEQVGWKLDRWIDSVIMQRSLVSEPDDEVFNRDAPADGIG